MKELKMESQTTNFIDEIAKCCLNKYEKLPKTGKPIQNEWTVLSCIVLYNPIQNNGIEVVSLGTGSKCIGATKMSAEGDILNDSHAEVMARRGFLVYLYENIKRAFQGQSSIFCLVGNKCKLKENIAFAFYSSQLPCGDASIIPKTESGYLVGEVIEKHQDHVEPGKTQDKITKESNIKITDFIADNSEPKTDLKASKLDITGNKMLLKYQKISNTEYVVSKAETNTKRNSNNEICDLTFKIPKLDHDNSDVHRTGAKCLQNALQDPYEPGINYHVLGQVRTKPGRGDRTLSVSCSDKIARWIHVGIQGALIDMLLEEPIFMKVFVFGNGVPFSKETLRRALLERNKPGDILNEPLIEQSMLCFPHIRKDSLQKPAAGSVLWVNTITPIFEVAVLGKKLGVTKKKLNSQSRQLSISKNSLYRRFLEIVSSSGSLCENSLCNVNCGPVSYSVMKKKSSRYLQFWEKVKQGFFGIWTVKGDIWNFTIEKL